MDRKGYFIESTIFENVTEEMTIFKEEIFGPVMVLLKFSNVDEAIRVANNTSYGLGAGVVGKDMSQIMKVVKGVQSGTVFVNCWYDGISVYTPFGGCKNSG